MSSKKTIYDFFTLTEKHLDAGKIKAKYKCLICDKEIQINSGVFTLLKGPYNKIMLHWDGLKIFIKLKNFTKVILN